MNRRSLLFFVLSLLLLFSFGCEDSNTSVAAKLRAYEKGSLSLQDISEGGGTRLRRQVIAFYERNPDAVSDMSSLVVSRCYGLESKYSQALALAQRYVAVNPEDWRGWRIVGTANSMLKSYDDAIWAYTNAVVLGDDGSCTALLIDALIADQTNVIKRFIPYFLRAKDRGQNPLEMRVEMAIALAGYAGQTGQEDLFIKAVAGIRPEQFASRPDYFRLVLTACKRFHSPEVQKLYEALQRQPGLSFTTTNDVAEGSPKDP